MILGHSRISISTPVGVKDARIEGAEIAGLWANTTELIGRPGRTLVEDFLNWAQDPKSILRFTATYAPLLWSTPQVGLPCEDKEFRFSIEDWHRFQAQLQDIWRAICDSEIKSAAYRGCFSGTDGIEVQSGKLVFRASNLLWFMVMEILTTPLERLRFCKRPGCSSPYFVAHHLKQAYCSPSCAEWAQKLVKKRWWDQSGESWLANRARQKRVRKNQRTIRSTR
jgi:hypothetical protein